MKKQLYLFVFLLAAIQTVSAQVMINPPLNGYGRFKIARVFNGSVTNMNSQPQTRLVISCLLSGPGGAIISWQKSNITLAPGNNDFKSLGIAAGTVSYDNGKGRDQVSNWLPAGQYDLSYKLESNNGGTLTLINETQQVIVSEDFPAVMLIAVENRDTITEKNPLFTWSSLILPDPALDGGQRSEIDYVIEIKELYKDQGVVDAMMNNPVHFKQDGIMSSSFVYPISGKIFSDSGTYVWQIKAYEKENFLSASEVWSFTYKPKIKIKENSPIIMLKTNRTNANTTVQKNVLRVGYHEPIGRSTPTALEARIINPEGKEIRDSKALSLMAVQGLNVFDLDLCTMGLDLPDGNYKLEIRNLNGEKMILNFIYIRKNDCE